MGTHTTVCPISLTATPTLNRAVLWLCPKDVLRARKVLCGLPGPQKASGRLKTVTSCFRLEIAVISPRSLRGHNFQLKIRSHSYQPSGSVLRAGETFLALRMPSEGSRRLKSVTSGYWLKTKSPSFGLQGLCTPDVTGAQLWSCSGGKGVAMKGVSHGSNLSSTLSSYATAVG